MKHDSTNGSRVNSSGQTFAPEDRLHLRQVAPRNLHAGGKPLAQARLRAHTVLRSRRQELVRRGIGGEQRRNRARFGRQVVGVGAELVQPHEDGTHALLLFGDLLTLINLDLSVTQSVGGEVPQIDHAVDAIEMPRVMDHDLARRVLAEDALPKLDRRA